MLRHRDIHGFVAIYHRNGIGGAGFYLCSFDLTDGLERRPLRAVVFDAPGHVAVISGNGVQKFRGDEFEPLIREALRSQEMRDPMAAHNTAEA